MLSWSICRFYDIGQQFVWSLFYDDNFFYPVLTGSSNVVNAVCYSQDFSNE